MTPVITRAALDEKVSFLMHRYTLFCWLWIITIYNKLGRVQDFSTVSNEWCGSEEMFQGRSQEFLRAGEVSKN